MLHAMERILRLTPCHTKYVSCYPQNLYLLTLGQAFSPTKIKAMLKMTKVSRIPLTNPSGNPATLGSRGGSGLNGFGPGFEGNADEAVVEIEISLRVVGPG